MSHIPVSQDCLLNFLPVKQYAESFKKLDLDVGQCRFYLELELELSLNI
jgi:hypothetical protein